MPERGGTAPLFVDEELRLLIVTAAADAGLTPEQWLTQAILEKVSKEPASGDEAVPRNASMENLVTAIRTLSDRVEEAERQTSSIIGPLSEQVHRLSETLELVKRKDTVSIAPLERAIVRISERLDAIEKSRD